MRLGRFLKQGSFLCLPSLFSLVLIFDYFFRKMKIIRVFPRKTILTPDDEDVRVNVTPTWYDEADEIHVSVLFDQDLDRAQWLAHQWEKVSTVRLGGPATGERGDIFVPGKYVKKGAVITSRGCPNHCWFCSVPKREGNIVRELPITEGFIVLDDNLLRCSQEHIVKVFNMLKKQKNLIRFTGGFEAAALTDWHIELLHTIKLDSVFFAYDTPDDFEPLLHVAKKLQKTSFSIHQLRVYCLVGYNGDTIEKAEKRLNDCICLGFAPMAMLYNRPSQSKEWCNFQRSWARPRAIFARCKVLKEKIF
jgi:hypothetical protein